MKKFLLTLCALLPAFLTANDNCCDYYPADCCNSYDSYFSYCDWLSDTSLFVDYLYWNTRRSNLDYAIPYVEATTQSSIGSIQKIDPSYQSGFRIELLKLCDGFGYDFHYTYLRANNSDSLSSPNGFYAGTRLNDKIAAVDIGDVTFAEAEWDLNFDEVSLSVSKSIFFGDCFTSHVFGGFTWARIDQTYETAYFEGATTFDRIKQTIDMDGYGINLGWHARYHLLSCLSFQGVFWYQGLVSNFDGRWAYLNSDGFVGDLTDTNWEMISVFNFVFAMRYLYEPCSQWLCCLKNVSVSVGYELHHWINMPDFLAINGSDEQTVLDHRTNLDFDGLFVRFGFGF